MLSASQGAENINVSMFSCQKSAHSEGIVLLLQVHTELTQQPDTLLEFDGHGQGCSSYLQDSIATFAHLSQDYVAQISPCQTFQS